MRTVNYEFLRPNEIIEEKKRFSVVYLPIGPLEWHGPHLALGMDPLNAAAISKKVAGNIGGVVMPVFYWGTERERDPKMLKNIGFDGDEWIIGMDFPANSIPSFYAKEDVFGLMVRECLSQLVKQGYKLIVIVNGHGAENHINTLIRLAKEFSNQTDSKVLYTMTTFLDDDGTQDYGHASKIETSILSYLYPDSVDLSSLPPLEKKLYNTDFAIVDDATFRGRPNLDFSVTDDPRKASREIGKQVMERSVRLISRLVTDTYYSLK